MGIEEGKKHDETRPYLFSWDEIPGNDEGRLIEFLKQNYSIEWVKTAKIEKIDDGKTIIVSTEKNFLSLKLNNEKTKVKMETDAIIRAVEFIAKAENGKLNIYMYPIAGKIGRFLFIAGLFSMLVGVYAGPDEPTLFFSGLFFILVGMYLMDKTDTFF